MTFELQPTLPGNLLALRPLREDDFQLLFEVAADPLLWEQHPASDRYQRSVFAAFFREAMESGGALIASDLSNNRTIGSSRYFAYSTEKESVEIGWTFLARNYWGGTYNGEMKALMLRHAFQFVKRVQFVIGTENFRSQKAVEKIGGVRIGTRTGTTHTDFVYEITPESYVALPT